VGELSGQRHDLEKDQDAEQHREADPEQGDRLIC